HTLLTSSYRHRRPPRPTLFPYTTLFRSQSRTAKLPGSTTKLLETLRDAVKGLAPAAGELGDVVAAGISAPFNHEDVASFVSLSQDRKSTRLNSSHVKISYAVFCLKKKNK